MVSNRKDRAKVASEMEMFLGDAAETFTEWLWGEFERYFSAPSEAAAAAVLSGADAEMGDLLAPDSRSRMRPACAGATQAS